MRVTLIIYSLGGGGAERVMSILANHWASSGWRVTLLTYDDGSVPPAYDLRKDVVRRTLSIAGESMNLAQAIANSVERLAVLRRSIRDSDPEVVISFLVSVNVRTILACVGLGCPVIVSEHSDPANQPIGWVWSALRRCVYPWAAAVVALTNDALGFFPGSVRRKGYVVPNPISLPIKGRSSGGIARRKIVMGMGRLSYEKGFDQLLQAFSAIAQNHTEWSLVIWGEGSLRSELEELRDELGLRERVSFPGWTSDPFSEMYRAGMFVLSSRYEGFGMALGEAMACGLPVVSFDCPSGPSEIVRHGVDGILVRPGDVTELAAAMARLFGNDAERLRLGARAVEVTSRFDKEKVMDMWESVLRDAVGS